VIFGVRRQSEAATALWFNDLEIQSGFAAALCHRIPNSPSTLVPGPLFAIMQRLTGIH